MAEHSEQFKQDLSALEEEYLRRRQEIEQRAEGEASQSEHETMSQTLKEKAQEKVPDYNPAVIPHDEMKEPLPPEAKEKIQSLINTSFQDIYKGIEAAQATGDSALIDDFHSLLSGQLRDLLIERKKLTPVS
ncbi:hypothetical protein KW791_03555 [Candidatus Parcubacteria bacterium]|nr:hypothetical protein [Candidatus Parcubacteria bacterium]